MFMTGCQFVLTELQPFFSAIEGNGRKYAILLYPSVRDSGKSSCFFVWFFGNLQSRKSGPCVKLSSI